MEFKRLRSVTYAGVLIALLVAVQFFAAGIGGQFVAGPLVNLILIISVMLCGLRIGLTVGVVSPVCAKLIGIGPFWTLIPFIILGNAAFVIVWHFSERINADVIVVRHLITAAAAAVVKFAVLYIGIVMIAVPFLLDIPAQAAAVVTNMFSYPQMLTAFAGGAAASVVVPILKKAVIF